jgi:hypothetical protein
MPAEESGNLVGLDIHSIQTIVSLARLLRNGIHKVQEKGEAKKFMATNYTERM